ncbi:hypothetical protein CDL15_Pgr022907 [Punica granatum]|nr:hypothetical protein CDL15_Pgr022907 [Punica granatum]
MGIQIKTSRDKRSNPALSPEIISSPGTRTPTLVARLMGLDLLPDSASSSHRPSSTLDTAPSIRRQSFHTSRTPHHRSSSGRKSCSDVDYSSYGTRSLPETPRMSLARRSDVDHHHRLSLQINKENTGGASEEFNFSRFRRELKCSSENGTARSPSHYARQIVKQVKERVSRRVGMIDITNMIRSRPEQGITKDHVSKPKKPPGNSRIIMVEDSSPSCSPRLRVPDTNKTRRPHCLEVQLESIQPTGDAVRMKPQCYNNTARKLSCWKSDSGNEWVTRPTKLAATEYVRKKQEEPFVRASKTTTTRSNHRKSDNNIVVKKKGKTTSFAVRKLVGTSNTAAAAAVLPVKKDPSPPATKIIPQKQVQDIQTSRHGSQLSVCMSHGYRPAHVVEENVMRDKLGSTTSVTTIITDHRRAESQYAYEILRSIGIARDTQLLSFSRWFSPSHPLDPSIFNALESTYDPVHSTTGDPDDGVMRQSLDRQCNRKLVFELVDELLADLLKPHLNCQAWINRAKLYGRPACRTGSELIDKLQAKIKSFPRADCHVLKDIDAIIDGDLPRSEVQISRRAFEEAGDGLVSELERDIWDDLVREVVTETASRTVHRNGVVSGTFDFGGQGLRGGEHRRSRDEVSHVIRC